MELGTTFLWFTIGFVCGAAYTWFARWLRKGRAG